MNFSHELDTAYSSATASWSYRRHAHYCWTTLFVASLLLFSPCGATATAEADAGRCSAILDRSDRLDCFDRLDGQPPRKQDVTDHLPDASLAAVDVIPVVLRQEKARPLDQSGFILPDEPIGDKDETRLVIGSTPSIGPSPPGSYLLMSCVSNISRIQIIARRPMERSRTTVRFVTGTTGKGPASEWRVLDGRRVVDGGRGIPAIERIRSLGDGGRLYIASDSAELNGLVFDLTGLRQVVERLRKACHW